MPAPAQSSRQEPVAAAPKNAHRLFRHYNTAPGPLSGNKDGQSARSHAHYTLFQQSRKCGTIICLSQGKWKIPVHNSKIEVLRGGDPARGTLLGGNLSSLMSLLATPLEQDWTDAILFLEDVGEPLYRIDRMLTQLAHCGKFNQARGIILGDFSLTRDQDRLERLRFHEQIWMRVLELTEPTGIPVWGDFPVGHGPDNLTLPHGAEAAMDSGQRILSFF
ncbi:MAG: hypothetical protein KKH60_03580 [Proteobacteria bacterium]|nr:hypothetical protein [Pseudomonadota bacterium]